MIQYEGRVFRPPSEAYSLIVQVTIGCSHNKCTFCDMYKEKKFRVRKLEEVKADFDAARAQYHKVQRIFLADGDALMCRATHMAEILRYIKQVFPECERVTAYGSPSSILCKTQEELNELSALGLSMIYLGLESGSDEVLRRVNKGETADEIVRAGLMVKEAGMKLSVTCIAGLGSLELSETHAIQTAEALSRMKPEYIGLLTLLFELETPLMRDWKEGRFYLMNPVEIAHETLILLEHIDAEGSVFRANHASNYVNLAGTLNRDRETMIGRLHQALEGKINFKSEEFRAR
ncbi:radical SAM protein [Faecalicatena contorta]|uniref:Radical SAM superfamily protein n=1 Tax=Faecalicatena contorta TaxID=39482 RepID=A0A316AI54_9FIRM|nr:radical SAM protein [Faecalicatena contorta]PWJ49597.1 radical SAM family protein [Faecalicatena contorta]SUQ14315.1 Radical SAM superfamily protein [Faecalicatena contorta]